MNTFVKNFAESKYTPRNKKNVNAILIRSVKSLHSISGKFYNWMVK
jgi:hypothetical protein